MVVNEHDGGIRTDTIALDVTGVGTATGAGSVSAAGALNYNVLLRLTGFSVGPANTPSTAVAPTGTVVGVVGALSGLIPGGAGGGTATAGLGNIAGTALRNGIPVAIGGTTSNPTFAKPQ